MATILHPPVESPPLINELWYGTSGPKDSEIVLVGEAWGESEHQAKLPFVGSSGNELTRILAEAGISRERVLLTNVAAVRPTGNDMWRLFYGGRNASIKEQCNNDNPSGSPFGLLPLTDPDEVRGLYPGRFVRNELARLHAQINASPRRLVICTGNYSLWATTDHAGWSRAAEAEGRRVPSGIMNWRGSMCHGLPEIGRARVLPIIHPAAIMRQWALRAITVHDLKARVPLALRGDWRPLPSPVFWSMPTFDQAHLKLRNWLSRLDSGERLPLVCDVETARRSLICIGFADSANFAMVIPFINGPSFESFWPIDQEIILVDLLRRLLTHKNVELIGQNFIYDTQYIQAMLAVSPKISFDTMLAHHLLWPGTPKSLDYLSSLYCHYHWYWKDDGKNWDIKDTFPEMLAYNCMDCVRTFEIAESLKILIVQLGLSRQWEETLERNNLALRMMNRGVLINKNLRGRLKVELTDVLSRIFGILETIIPQEWVDRETGKKQKTPWYRSPFQQRFVFGELLGMKLPRHRKTGNDTLGAEAMDSLKKKHPEFTRIFNLLLEARSVGVFQSHFIDADLDPDGRMRCSFNVAGTETFRWSSSTNAFGAGTNLQNIPKGDED